MPAYSADPKKCHTERVWSRLVQQPMISGEAIRRRLEMDGLVLDRNYINGLVDHIHKERARRADQWVLGRALADFQDATSEIARVGGEIINDPMAKNQDQVMAMREVREAYNTSFEKLFDAGVFERKLGTLDMAVRNTPLPEERKQAIRARFENWGLLQPPPTISERLVHADVKS